MIPIVLPIQNNHPMNPVEAVLLLLMIFAFIFIHISDNYENKFAQLIGYIGWLFIYILIGICILTPIVIILNSFGIHP